MAGFDPRDSTSVDTPVPDYVGDARAAARRAEDRPAEGILRQGPRRRQCADRCATRCEVYEKLGAKLRRGEPAEPAAVRADVLRRRAGGVFFEPVALRRRALRSSLREPDGPARSVQALARRGLRRRGQATHHDRHVRAVRGLLRRLLPAAQKVRALITRRFRARLRAGRRADGADVADAGVRPRRQGRRSDHDVSERHLHHRREPRRPAGDVDSVRLRRASCRWGCRSSARISPKRSCSSARIATSGRRSGTSAFAEGYACRVTNDGAGKPSSVWRSTRSSRRAARSSRARRPPTARRRTRRRTSSTSAIRACCRC